MSCACNFTHLLYKTRLENIVVNNRRLFVNLITRVRMSANELFREIISWGITGLRFFRTKSFSAPLGWQRANWTERGR